MSTKTQMKSDNSSPPETVIVRRVASPKVEAGPCPISAGHENTRVYKTVGRTRRCKCNDCGHTWKQTGPFADELREYAMDLAKTLRSAPRTKDSTDDVVIITVDVIDGIAKKLTALATT